MTSKSKQTRTLIATANFQEAHEVYACIHTYIRLVNTAVFPWICYLSAVQLILSWNFLELTVSLRVFHACTVGSTKLLADSRKSWQTDKCTVVEMKIYPFLSFKLRFLTIEQLLCIYRLISVHSKYAKQCKHTQGKQNTCSRTWTINILDVFFDLLDVDWRLTI